MRRETKERREWNGMVMNGRSLLLPSRLPSAMLSFCTLSSKVGCLGVMGSGFRRTDWSFPFALRPLWEWRLSDRAHPLDYLEPTSNALLNGTSPSRGLLEQRFALSVGLEVVLQN